MDGNKKIKKKTQNIANLKSSDLIDLSLAFSYENIKLGDIKIDVEPIKLDLKIQQQEGIDLCKKIILYDLERSSLSQDIKDNIFKNIMNIENLCNEKRNIGEISISF